MHGATCVRNLRRQMEYTTVIRIGDRAAAGANGNRKRKWRATPKRLEKLKELCKLAALGKAASKKNFKREKVKTESLAKMSKALARSLGL